MTHGEDVGGATVPHTGRRITALLAAISMVFLSAVVTTSIQTAEAQTAVTPPGSGDVEDPHRISTLAHLLWVQQQTNGGAGAGWSSGRYFLQTADIDLISIDNWTPIGEGDPGASSAPANSFQGVYDGGNFTIRNLRIDRPNADHQGLFGYLWGGTLRNIRIEGADVTSRDRSGILLGSSNCFSCAVHAVGAVNRSLITTTIERVSVTGALNGRDRVGGIVGNPARNTTITGQNVFVGQVDGRNDVGGLVGRASGDSRLSFSYARAQVSGSAVASDGGVGILIGNASTGAGTFEEMYATGTATATGGTKNAGAIGFAPRVTTPTNGSHTITDIWVDGTGGLVVIGNSGDPSPSWVNAAGGGSLGTGQMQGGAAATNMTGTNDRWDFSASGEWRTVTLPDDDYPVFTWQAGDAIEISGTVTRAGLAAAGVTVVAQSGDELLPSVTTTTDASGGYSLGAYTQPTRRLFARGLDDGLPVGASEPFTGATTVDLALEPRSLTISDDDDAGWIRDGDEILSIDSDANLNIETLRDQLLDGARTVVAGIDITVDASLTLAAQGRRALTLRAGRDITFTSSTNITATSAPLDVVVWSDIGGQSRGLVTLAGDIDTNGGHLWVGGGDGSTTWNGLSVGDGRAISPASTSATALRLEGLTVRTGAGEQYYSGEQASSGSSGFGTSLSDTTLSSTTGTIRIEGHSNASNAVRFTGTNRIGWDGSSGIAGITSGDVEIHGTKTPTSSSGAATVLTGIGSTTTFASTGDIHFTGTNGNGNNLLTFWGETYVGWNGTEESQDGRAANVTIESDRGGAFLQRDASNFTAIRTRDDGVFTFTNTTFNGFTLSDASGSIRTGTIAIDAAGPVRFGDWQAGTMTLRSRGSAIDGAHAEPGVLATGPGGTVELVADALLIDPATRIASDGGTIAIRPHTTAASIGIATGEDSATLVLPAPLFASVLEQGFARITVGGVEHQGVIRAGGFTARDPLVLRTDGSVQILDTIASTVASSDALTIVAGADRSAGDITGGSVVLIGAPSGEAWFDVVDGALARVFSGPFNAALVLATDTAVTGTAFSAEPSPDLPAGVAVIFRGPPPAPGTSATAVVGGSAVDVTSTAEGDTAEDGSTIVASALRLDLGDPLAPDVTVVLDLTGVGQIRTDGAGPPQVTVTRDATAQVTVSGLRGESSVQVLLTTADLTTRTVSTLTTGVDGGFSGDVRLDGTGDIAVDGRPLPIGRHVLQLVGIDDDGRGVVLEQTITIAQPTPAPEEDRIAAGLPSLAPGDALATNTGVAETVLVIPAPEDRRARIESDGWPTSGWTMAIDVLSPTGGVEPSDTGARVELVSGGLAAVSGEGFLPGTRADVWLFSTPVLLGSVTIAEDGTFSGDVLVDPASVAPGEHTLQLQGVGSDGYVRAVNLGVAVIAAPVTDDAPGDVLDDASSGSSSSGTVHDTEGSGAELKDEVDLVPSSIQAGGGPVPLVPLSLGLLVAMLTVLLLIVESGRRTSASVASRRRDWTRHEVRFRRLSAFDDLEHQLRAVRQQLTGER